MVRKTVSSRPAPLDSSPSSTATTELSLNERILNECHKLYTDKEHGLVEMGKTVGLQLLAPRRRIIIMLIGNHSAGKSSFINWYVENNVQRTGVAIETQGFTFVTSGKKRETLTGRATLHLYPHFKALEKIKGVVDYLNTEIVPSNAKKFNLVTFVDTPGLVDGEMYYPYDVEKTILWLGNLADQIFVFFDPIGQALCRRTVNLVEKLNASHSEKINFFLSKADEAGQESDRQKVMMQIVQELCKRPGLNKCGFEMPTIYIPDPNLIRATQCVNQIESVCVQIEKAINYTIQNTLNSLEKDCDQVTELIHAKITEDNDKRKSNLKAGAKGILWVLVALVYPLLTIITAMSSDLNSFVGPAVAKAINSYTRPIDAFWSFLPQKYHLHANGFFVLMTFVLLFVAWYSSKLQPCLSRKDKNVLIARREYIRDVVKPKKVQLYTSYLAEIISGQDLDS
jgi:hypothetical protein